MAEKLSGALRRVIEFVNVPPEAMREALQMLDRGWEPGSAPGSMQLVVFRRPGWR